MVPYEYKYMYMYPHELKYLLLMTNFNKSTGTYAPEFMVPPLSYSMRTRVLAIIALNLHDVIIGLLGCAIQLLNTFRHRTLSVLRCVMSNW